MSYTDAMNSLFDDISSADVFGATLTYNGIVIPCVKIPIKSGYVMQLTSMDKSADVTVDIRRTTYVSSGLAGASNKRPVVTIENQQYEVFAMENDDTANPIVRLPCKLLQ